MTKPPAPSPPPGALGQRLFGWSRHPQAPTVAAIALALVVALLVVLELLAPRQGIGVIFEGRTGFYAIAGAIGAALIGLTGAVIARVLGAKTDGDADGD